MQYVKNIVCTNGSLKARESYKNFWCSQTENALPTHIFNMGSDAIFASRGFLLGDNSTPRTRDLFREIGISPAIPNYLPAYNYKKISNLLLSFAISKKDCFRPFPEKISLKDKYLPGALIVRFGEWASYLSQLVASRLRLLKRCLLLAGKCFVKNESFPVRTEAYSDFFKALLPWSKVIAYRRPSDHLASVPSG